MEEPATRPLLVDVARHAGVSRATASRVLNGSTRVSAKAEAAVRRAVNELGYVADPVARALVSAGGYRVVVAVTGETADVLHDPYFGRFLAAAARAAGDEGCGVVARWLPLASPHLLDEIASDRSVAGVVLVNTTYEVLRAVPRRLGGRVVSVGVGTPDVPSVDVDSAPAVESLVRHLYSSGRRSIAMIEGPGWLPCTRAQTRAYARVMDEVGAPIRAVQGDFTPDGGARAARLLLREWPDVDAVFAISDMTAFGLLSVLEEKGRRVPGDIAVASFDDVPLAATMGLTTATHPVDDIAAAAVRLVVKTPGNRQSQQAFSSAPVLRRTA